VVELLLKMLKALSSKKKKKKTIERKKPGTVSQACNPRYLEGEEPEDLGSRPAWGGKFSRSHLNQ
jgi:hypothetical protein